MSPVRGRALANAGDRFAFDFACRKLIDERADCIWIETDGQFVRQLSRLVNPLDDVGSALDVFGRAPADRQVAIHLSVRQALLMRAEQTLLAGLNGRVFPQ